jgi:hypothetical protein
MKAAQPVFIALAVLAALVSAFFYWRHRSKSKSVQEKDTRPAIPEVAKDELKKDALAPLVLVKDPMQQVIKELKEHQKRKPEPQRYSSWKPVDAADKEALEELRAKFKTHGFQPGMPICYRFDDIISNGVVTHVFKEKHSDKYGNMLDTIKVKLEHPHQTGAFTDLYLIHTDESDFKNVQNISFGHCT